MTKPSRKNATNLTLKVAIIQAGKTQREIAERAGVRELRVSLIITGRVQPTASEKRAIAKALRCPQSALFPAALDVPQEAAAS